MLNKLFAWVNKKQKNTPAINFGRYSDNNKTIEKTARWTASDNFFKEKKYLESYEAFFDYLRDEETDNVNIKKNGEEISFEIFQGSKIVRGIANLQNIKAEVSLAKMPTPSVAVMRRLLEQNFSLYYSRYALDGERLCMRFDSDTETANPNKLYYALKELATRADKQDDLLIQDFSSLLPLDIDHIQEIPLTENEIKYSFFQKWISDTLSYINTLDTEKMSGGIAYMLLALAFKIDYLICPESTFLSDLEKIPAIYFAKDDRPTTDKNKDMITAFTKLQAKTADEVYKCLFKSKSCFAIVSPQNYATIADAIIAANNNIIWYRDNNYPIVAAAISEYGIAFCQYCYSLPRPLTEFYHVMMQANNADYFAALGFSELLYDLEKNKYNNEVIIKDIQAIQNKWQKKYPKLSFKVANLQFDNPVSFNHSFTGILEKLNFDS